MRAGMFVGDATRLCPGNSLVVAPFEFDRYHEVSETVYSILAGYASACSNTGSNAGAQGCPLRLLPVSVDEAYLELDMTSGHGHGQGGTDPESVSADIRARVRAETGGCEASVGIGPNMLLAKLATRKAKPAGQFRVGGRPEDIEIFLRDIPVGDLPGVGYQTADKLRSLGAHCCCAFHLWCFVLYLSTSDVSSVSTHPWLYRPRISDALSVRGLMVSVPDPSLSVRIRLYSIHPAQGSRR